VLLLPKRFPWGAEGVVVGAVVNNFAGSLGGSLLGLGANILGWLLPPWLLNKPPVLPPALPPKIVGPGVVVVGMLAGWGLLSPKILLAVPPCCCPPKMFGPWVLLILPPKLFVVPLFALFVNNVPPLLLLLANKLAPWLPWFPNIMLSITRYIYTI